MTECAGGSHAQSVSTWASLSETRSPRLGETRPSDGTHSVPYCTYSVSVPFVLGTPGIRGSGSTAMRSERAVDLKTASLM